jgi:undecaprenyl diphosphate synthase
MPAVDKQTENVAVPRHIAIIMDGNGRWAASKRLPRAAGHRQGAEAVRRCVKGCIAQGVECLTLYAFSSENWKRPADEVSALMSLLRLYIRQELKDLNKNGVCIRFIGDRTALASDICSLLEEAEEFTRENQKLILTIALNYGSQREIAAAARRLAEMVAAGEMQPADITAETLAGQLDTSDLPDPDLVIRTSGEKRLSNFLLWQSAYSELLFIDEYWPDFTEETLALAVAEFAARDRRFGARD